MWRARGGVAARPGAMVGLLGGAALALGRPPNPARRPLHTWHIVVGAPDGRAVFCRLGESTLSPDQSWPIGCLEDGHPVFYPGFRLGCQECVATVRDWGAVPVAVRPGAARGDVLEPASRTHSRFRLIRVSGRHGLSRPGPRVGARRV